MQRPVQQLALVFGLVYVVLGVVGFAVTGFSDFFQNTGSRLILFEINPFHNVVHLGVGALWLLAWRLQTLGQTEGIHLGIGGIYVLAAVLGFIGAPLEILSIGSALDAVNFLHIASGALAIFAAVVVGDAKALEDPEYARKA